MSAAAVAQPTDAAAGGPLIFGDQARTAYIVAGGESVLDAPLARLPARATIAVTDAWHLVPDAAVLYAADIEWYYVHRAAIAAGFAGEKWCAWLDAPAPAIDQAHGAAAPEARAQLVRGLSLQARPFEPRDGLSPQPGVIYIGSIGRNSVVQAMHYAVSCWGARRLVLIGVDLVGPRYFGEQHEALRYKCSDYSAFRRCIERLVRDLARIGVPVINASPVSHIAGAEHRSLDEVLA